MLLASAIGDFMSGMLGLLFFFGLMAGVVASAVWFFRGPATAADRYVDALALQLQNPQEAALFRNVYKTKDPKSTTVAWLLTAFLSPTIGYVYQGKWALAVISFVTFQGFLIWWFVALFTTPMEVLARNKRLADESLNQVMIGRGGMGYGHGQVINVNQYAYAPAAQPSAPGPVHAPSAAGAPSASDPGAFTVRTVGVPDVAASQPLGVQPALTEPHLPMHVD